MESTSAEAGKLVRKIEEEILLIKTNEQNSKSFVIAMGEDAEDLRPKYDFAAVQERLEELYDALRKVKHTINMFNTSHELPGFPGLTVDQALVKIPQLNGLKMKLERMVKRLPKERLTGLNSRNNIIEYTIANYDIEEVEKKYKEVSEEISRLQLSLDKVNTTETMEIDVEF